MEKAHSKNKTRSGVLIRRVIIVFILIVFATNVFPIFSSWKWYSFTTKNGEFHFDMFPAKGRDFAMMERWWLNYKKEERPADTTIYRTFNMRPYAFWEWGDYLFDKKYRYPYIAPEEVEKAH